MGLAFFGRSASNHPSGHLHRFDTLPFSVEVFLRFAEVRASPLASGLACLTGRIEFTLEGSVPFRRCGPAIHLLLLPTSHRCDAVAVGYRAESVSLKRTCTSLSKPTRRRTSSGRQPRDEVPSEGARAPEGRHP
jgi:hypothetical protein